jgi:hypothetical protein
VLEVNESECALQESTPSTAYLILGETVRVGNASDYESGSANRNENENASASVSVTLSQTDFQRNVSVLKALRGRGHDCVD